MTKTPWALILGASSGFGEATALELARTGLIAAFLAQFPRDHEDAVAAAVYLGGLAGQMAARDLGEKCVLATDILTRLGAAMEECAAVPHRV